MTPYYQDDQVTLYHGDCLEVLVTLPDSSVDAVCTDPPYGLANTDPAHVAETIVRWVNGERDYLPGGSGFMGKAWDAFVPPVAVWDECLRVLKPGGHVVAFAGSRTVDLMTLGLRLAGFEVRDSIAWLYGSGFPKSLDVSKAIDKAAGAEREVVGMSPHFTPGRGFRAADATTTGATNGGTTGGYNYAEDGRTLTAPATPDAERWQGWGTALKPAFEPIVVARKPLTGTVAGNVLAHGTGALNIDGCRVGNDGGTRAVNFGETRGAMYGKGEGKPTNEVEAIAKGRWPTNVVLDDTQAAELDRQSGVVRSSGHYHKGEGTTEGRGSANYQPRYYADSASYDDHGGASRFFPTFRYEAKAPTSERPTYYRPTCECEDSWPTHTLSVERATDGTTAPASSSTSKSGSATTADQSPTATRSTTSTATSSTTTPTTSSRSPRPTTSASTQAASCETATGGSRAASAESSSPSAPLTGTSAARDGRSTVGAARATSQGWSATSVCGECGAPSRREAHATVKPLDLMRWLVRLVTPPGGTVLEPFAGSGTTAEACVIEGFRCIAIEREADYLPLIKARLSKPLEPVLDLGSLA